MVSDRKVSRVVGGKSVRACDNCVRKSARWYCAADDAFLCESCDSSVHSANPLARRHERVRLKMASPSSSLDDASKAASWHQGFTRKPRTPRHKKIGKLGHIPLVPEPDVCSDEENEEQLLYRVPVLDPFEVSLQSNAVEISSYGEIISTTPPSRNSGININMNIDQSKAVSTNDEMFQGISLPSELDLAEFAADVESLLGKGLDDMEGLRILDCDEEGKDLQCCWRSGMNINVKAEDGDGDDDVFGEEAAMDEGYYPHEIDFELNFDEQEYKTHQNQEGILNKALLKLDYQRVMSAWDDNKSPWTTGERPEFSSGDWWTHCCLSTSGAMHGNGEMSSAAMTSGQPAAALGDGGREARVSRYREKRRTRLFSKKIRYEVRKLNAEKRPRMKGRFVKRSASAFPLPLLNK